MEADLAIVLCTYNGQQYLSQQLNSYKDQVYKKWSLFVCDDNSTDATKEIISDFIDSNPNLLIKLFVNEYTLGFVRNFLRAIKKIPSGFKYYAFSDQDDIWCKEKLIKSKIYLDTISCKIPAIYCSRTKLIDKFGKEIGLSPLIYNNPSFNNSLVQNIAGGNTMVFNHAAYKLISSVQEDIDITSHDWFLYQLVTGAGGNVFYDIHPEVLYRQHENNVTGVEKKFDLSYKLLKLKKLFNNYFKFCNDKHIYALKQCRVLFTTENKIKLDMFERSRNTWLLPRLFGFLKSGVYKQNFHNLIFFWIWVVLNKI